MAKTKSTKAEGADFTKAGAAGFTEAGAAKTDSNGRKILVIDVGGTHVKVLATGQRAERKVNSGKEMTPAKMVAAVKKMTSGWKYDVISMGYPGPVVLGKPLHEPHNLGGGWVGFDFHKAFGKPIKIVNDAAMQALGSYHGGRMLFLGLGTGLGSAMVVDGVVEPMELAHLPYKKGRVTKTILGCVDWKSWGRRSGGSTSRTLSSGCGRRWSRIMWCWA